LYTAITRSKNFLILCGEEDAFRLGIERNDEMRRKTTLREKLREILSEEEMPVEKGEVHQETSYLDIHMHANPMIGMENVTPYDFM
jgi:exodeoxyribonuclease V alpha subunit